MQLKLFYNQEVEHTSYLVPIKENVVTIYIGTKENERIKQLIESVKKDLLATGNLEKDEEFEISKFDTYVMKCEEENQTRIDGFVYYYCKQWYEREVANER